MTVILGIDPGGSHTGMIVRKGADCLAFKVVERKTRPMFSSEYLSDILTLTGIWVQTFTPDIVAIEGLVKPTPHMGMTDPMGLVATGVTLGAVLAWWPEALIVRPGGHGSAERRAYPDCLWGPNETKGTGYLRHARSAWDVAGQARRLKQVKD